VTASRPRRILRACALLAAVSLPAACRREAPRTPATATKPPKGDVIWLMDPAAVSDASLDASLEPIGAAAVFVEAGRLGAAAGPDAFRASEPPPKPLRAPVVLVLEPDASLDTAWTAAEGPDADALARAAGAGLSRLASDGEFGRTIGVHLDFAFAPAGAARYAAFIGALRGALSPGVFVSISLRALPATADDRKKVAPVLDAADALVAIVFGVGARLDPIATDALHRPWWAGYDTRPTGRVLTAGGEPPLEVPERLIEPLSGSPRFDFENDLSVNDAAIWAFTLTARSAVRQDSLAIEPGDRLAFRLPAVSEMLFQLGSNMAGKRYALGRALLFGGASEGERLFDLAAFADVLLGRALAPALEASVHPAGRNAIAVDLVNHSAHASTASRVDNWVEVDLAPAHPADVQVGGFDRYEVYDAAGRPVTPGRATVVRLFETLIAPRETVTPARIVARGALPKACCRYRIHAVAAAGPEVAGDWIEPPPPPEPTRPAKPSVRAPRSKRG
jgi:hypothetical protein